MVYGHGVDAEARSVVPADGTGLIGCAFHRNPAVKEGTPCSRPLRSHSPDSAASSRKLKAKAGTQSKAVIANVELDERNSVC